MEPYPIKLHIHSYGGSVFAGIAAMDTITNLGVDVHTIIEGSAASAATFLSLAGSHRIMSRNSYMLIHQLSSGYYGKYEDIKDDVENLDELMTMIKRIYNERSSVPQNKLDEILKHDLWFSSKKCLKYGLVDEVV
jgi:ATP-dependent Clp endopeptidase proteolytic subunit ClpP